MAEIDVVSSCLIKMTRDISMSKLELHTWDLHILSVGYTQKGLLYLNPQSQQLQQTLIDHLKSSLSRTLDFFPPLAGRLATIAHDSDMLHFFVDCNNAGAEFTHAVAAAVSVSDVLQQNYAPGFISSFFPLNGVYNHEGVSRPLLAVQVTELADGVFIGCATNHAVIDGDSHWHFINSWSQISRGFDTISRLPVFERWFSSAAGAGGDNRLVHLPTLKKNASLNFSTPQKIFHFSKESLAKLKAKANSEAGTDKISTLQALLSHLWRSTTRCGGRNSSASHEPLILVIMIGTRARLSLPEGYFGNAFCSAWITMSESELLQRGLGYTALKINETISQQTREEIMLKLESNETLSGPPALMVGGSPRFDVYGNDFGWGKPVALRNGPNRYAGMVTVSAAAEAGGIDLEVCLAEEMLKALECDGEFIAPFTT